MNIEDDYRAATQVFLGLLNGQTRRNADRPNLDSYRALGWWLITIVAVGLTGVLKTK